MTTTIEKFTPGQVDTAAVLKTLNLDPRNPQTQALLLVCERYELDPLLKHMVLIQGSPYVTRDGYLAIAHRSGLFDGMEVVEQSETSSHYVAKVAVYRKDWGRPVTMIGRYPKSNRMAKDYGPEMAVKVAEVAALRRAFNVTGVGAADERFDDQAKPVEIGVAGQGAEGDEPRASALRPTSGPAVPIDEETGEIVDAEIVEEKPKRRVRKPPVAAVPPAEEPTQEQQLAQVEKARDLLAMSEKQSEVKAAIDMIGNVKVRRAIGDDFKEMFSGRRIPDLNDDECEMALNLIREHVATEAKPKPERVRSAPVQKIKDYLEDDPERPFEEPEQPMLGGDDAA